MRRAKTILRLAIAALLLSGLAAVSWTALRIARQSTRDEAQRADVILVLGAAEYRGKPSPVLKGRLDHGLGLYRDKQAPYILTTGGAGGDPVFTEGEVGRDYLIRQGVPAEAILVEAEGETTMQSAAAVAEMMRQHGMRSCIVVSDGYHIYRAKKMLEAEGFRVYGSPRPEQPQSAPHRWWLYTRQSVGYWLWRMGIKV